MRGIVLKRSFFREHDLLVTILSEELGKIEVVSRSGQKFASKMAAHVEPFNFIKLEFAQGKRLRYFTSVYALRCFCNVKEDLRLIDIVSKVIFFTNFFIKERQQCTEVFELLVEALFWLENCQGVEASFFLELFLVKLCALESLLPEEAELLEYCVFRSCWLGDRESFYQTYSQVIKCCKKGRLIDVLRSEFGVDEASVLRGIGLYFMERVSVRDAWVAN